MAILVLLFIVVPVAELFVIIRVGQWIGVWPTLALLLAGAIAGSLLLKHQGRSAWRRFNQALAERRFPGREVADGVLIIIGGTLLLTPGFLTDILGILLLIPPTRALARAALRRVVAGRFTVLGVGGFPGGGFPSGEPGGRGGRAPSRDYDVEGTAEEVRDDDERRLPRE